MVPPSLSCWYRRHKFADVNVMIVENIDGDLVAGKPTVLDIVPAHRLVLYEHSKFFQAKVQFDISVAHNQILTYKVGLHALHQLARAPPRSRGSHLCA
jgi:hypothetical protein